MNYSIAIFIFVSICILSIPLYPNNISGEDRKDENPEEYYYSARDKVEYYRVNVKDSLIFFAENLKVDSDDKCRALKEYALAEYFYAMNDFGTSFEHSLKAIFIYENHVETDQAFLAKSYSIAGLACELLFRYQKALSYYEKALNIAKNLKEKDILAEIYSNRSFTWYGLGDFNNAISDLQTALKIEEEIKDTVNLSKDLNNMGYIYGSWGKYETSIEYYKKALEYSLQKGNVERSAICYNNIGMNYFQQGEFEFAEQFINKALEIDITNNFQLNAAKRYNNLGLVYFKQGNADKAVSNFEYAAKVFQEQGDSVSYAKALINISDIFFKIGKTSEAFRYLQKGYNISLNTKSLPLIEHNTAKMYRYYKGISDYKQALFYKELYDELSDSLYSQESAKVVEELETRYETEKKEEEISRLSSESELKETIIIKKNQQKNLLVAFVIFLFAVLLATIYIIVKIRKQRKQLLALNNVKNRLFAMISHDLRGYSGTFQDAGMVIRHHLKNENPDKVIEISEYLEISAHSYSSQLDNILNWAVLQLNGYQLCPEAFSPHAECVQIIENLDESRKLKGNIFKNEIDETVNIIMDKGAFAIIMRNLLTNANKFTEQGMISVKHEKTDRGFRIVVMDTGIGMDKETLNDLFRKDRFKSERGTRGEKGAGVGLSLVVTFVDLSGGAISVKSEIEKGTSFVMDFNM